MRGCELNRLSMHELSIVSRIVQIVTDAARTANARKVTAVTLKIGELACVHEKPLRWAFEVATSGTLLEGAELKIIAVPLAIYCDACRLTVELPSLQSLACPRCGTLSGQIRSGDEMDIDTITIIDSLEEACTDSPENPES